MAKINVEIGPMAAIYVGLAGQGGALSQLTSLRTLGGTLTYECPEDYIDVIASSVQSGRHTLNVKLTFLSDDDSIVQLAMGNIPNDGYPDATPTFQNLSVLLLHPDGANGNHNIWIPFCYVKKNLNLNWAKNSATAVPLTFFYTNRNVAQHLYYKRDNAGLASIMGGQWPIN